MQLIKMRNIVCILDEQKTKKQSEKKTYREISISTNDKSNCFIIQMIIAVLQINEATENKV